MPGWLSALSHARADMGPARHGGSGLRGMLAQRRKLLQYLRRADFDAYARMLSSLGLKDTYAKQARMLLLCRCVGGRCLMMARLDGCSLPLSQDRLAIRRTRGIDS